MFHLKLVESPYPSDDTSLLLVVELGLGNFFAHTGGVCEYFVFSKSMIK